MLSFSAFSCQSLRLRVAENYYEQNAYSKAIPKYEQVLGKEFNFDAAEKVADCYKHTGNSLKAEFWYKKLVNRPEALPQHKLQLGECLMENGKYEEASEMFKEYLKLNNDNRIKRLALACDSIHWFFEDTLTYQVSLPSFNKGYESNFSPVFYRDGIVFLSDRTVAGKSKVRSPYTGKEYLDLFYTRQIDESDKWLEPELLKGNVNKAFDEGPACFSSDFHVMYLTRNDYDGKELETNEKSINLLKIYSASIEGNYWKDKGEVPFNGNDYSVGHPTLSKDGNTMFFVSDMPWGYGGTDLYSITKVNGKWGDPVNLGNKINTEGNEMFPFLGADSVLYFASDGHVGMGGLDVYLSFAGPDGWSRPENLQYPVNSSKDDFGFVIDSSNTYGYFTSSRTKNTDQIYAFKKNPPVFTLELVTQDSRTSKPLAKIKGELNRNGARVSTLSTDAAGVFHQVLKAGSIYTLDIKLPGYFRSVYNVSTMGRRKSALLSDTLVIAKIELKKKLSFPSLYFPGKTKELTPEIKAGLDSLADLMILNPEIQVELASHTDSRGYASENMKLSIDRSDEMAFYLIGKGISSNRLVSLGYGESRLLNNCRDGILCLEEDHRINNRVEVRVVDLLKE